MTAHNADDIERAAQAIINSDGYGATDQARAVLDAVSDRIAAREREACAKQVEGAGYPAAAKCIRLHSEYGRAADLGETPKEP